MISPVCSARGMKSSGERRPRTGCCQRISASKPTSSRVSITTIGLKVQPQLVALHRLAQLALHLQLLQRARVQLRVGDLEAGAAAGLGAVHGRVGVAQHVLRPR